MKTKTTLSFPLELPIDVEATLDCGQAFRWQRVDNLSSTSPITMRGVVGGKVYDVYTQDGSLYIDNATKEEEEFFKNYFSLDIDYSELQGIMKKDVTLAKCLQYAPGIRVLRQPFEEVLFSFLISQNNNIKRIKKIINTMCETWGNRISYEGVDYYTFPSVETLAKLTTDDWAILHAGYRVPGLMDAAQKLSSGDFNPECLKTLSYEEVFKKLQEIHGVGPKVSACVALFGLGYFEAFPIDVWIKRAMAELFPKGLPKNILPFAGIAQQYIFHYIRTATH